MFEEVVSVGVLVIEVVGALIMIVGAGFALVAAVPSMRRADSRGKAYERLRRNVGRAILLGLEILIVADIIRTILVDQTPQSVAVLAGIVAIRIALSFSLEVEIDGIWPWAKWRVAAAQSQVEPGE
ncbi:DUF1622 domain-containing protein [Arthrobacter sp. SX1312]|uniref:DUF1622 domain-containing protein n=1 Tax=Arthrobacter sp. SX1312 TaxID=2058896 RepID=UPI002158462C|nr:DUF1622 domain-containing protein [Arthrobacter sp. SX1312]